MVRGISREDIKLSFTSMLHYIPGSGFVCNFEGAKSNYCCAGVRPRFYARIYDHVEIKKGVPGYETHLNELFSL